jgi:hypothetical protein
MKLSKIEEGVLVEAGLSRILTHIGMKNEPGQGKIVTMPFTILTAFRSEYSLATNRKRNRTLEKEFRKLGVGAIKLIGHWSEAPEGIWFGRNYNDIDSSQLTKRTEDTYFVLKPPDMQLTKFREWVVNMTNDWKQDAAVFCDGHMIYYLDKTNYLKLAGNQITIDKITDAYSSIKGKKFVFEGTIRPCNGIGNMFFRCRGLGWV